MQSDNHQGGRFKCIIFSWLIFSILYLAAAYHKPFHVDEFYSWVYAQRCSAMEILTLKKYGIGHPPLYHLCQKFVQTVFDTHHHLQVRLVNYVIGSLFVCLLTAFMLKQKHVPLFCYAVAGSATVLEVFIFSRMYGLVCLAALLLLCFGEKYNEQPGLTSFVGFMGSCLLGLFADYSFIMLSFYILIVLFRREAYGKYVMYVFLALLVAAGALSPLYGVKDKAKRPAVLLYGQLHDLALTFLKTVNVIINFWFVELIAAGLLLVATLLIIEIFGRVRNRRIDGGGHRSYLTCIAVLLKERAGHILDLRYDYARVFLTVVGAWLIVVAANPHFWTGIIRKRFLTILCPFIFFLIIRHFSTRALHALAIMLFCSGLIFASSNRVAGIYPPPAFDDVAEPVVYQDEWAYATHYLGSRQQPPDEPFIVDFRSFNRRCRICKMGSSNIPFQTFDTLWLVCNNASDPDTLLPDDFIMTAGGEANFTWTDAMQFRYLTPLPKTIYLFYKYQKKFNSQ